MSPNTNDHSKNEYHLNAPKTIKLERTPEWDQALSDLLSSNQTLFLTGKAGTGKSTLLKEFRKHTTKQMVALAPTGVAALNIQGETIHSFFRFKSNITVQEAIKLGRNEKRLRLFDHLDTILIDEISMVRADLLDCVHHFLKEVRGNNAPFGGIQMIWVGDLHQLPPVVTPKEAVYFSEIYDSPYFFSSKVMNLHSFSIQLIELTTIFRQKDKAFIDILNSIRYGTVTQGQLDILNQQVIEKNTELKSKIILTATNKAAEFINQNALKSLPGELMEFEANMSKKFETKYAPTAPVLQLKEGAQVMFVNNDSSGDWVNGTVGTVIEINEIDFELIIETQDNKEVKVCPHKWTMHSHQYDEKTKTLIPVAAGTFQQFPIKLAWGITIHKSQGKTFESIAIDFGNGAFAEGQAYVALSRSRSLSTIQLKKPIRKRDIITNVKVQEFLNQFSTTESEYDAYTPTFNF